MFPFLKIAEFYFPTYNILLAIGIIVGLTVLFLLARRKRVMLHFISDHFIALFFFTLLFARLSEVLLHGYPLLDIPFFWRENGGFDFYGGVIGFLATLAYLSYRYNENFLVWLDLSVCSASVVLVFHHIGNFLTGAAYGKQTTLPWGVTFTNPDARVFSTLPLHPVQIYSAIVTLTLVILGGMLFKRTAVSGKSGIFIMLTLSIAYFFLDFLRDDSAPAFGLRASQYFTLLLAGISAFLVIRMKHQEKNAKQSELDIR